METSVKPAAKPALLGHVTCPHCDNKEEHVDVMLYRDRECPKCNTPYLTDDEKKCLDGLAAIKAALDVIEACIKAGAPLPDDYDNLSLQPFASTTHRGHTLH